jgi:hypothetical protein
MESETAEGKKKFCNRSTFSGTEIAFKSRSEPAALVMIWLGIWLASFRLY